MLKDRSPLENKVQFRSSRPRMPEGYGIASSPGAPGPLKWDHIRREMTGSRNYWVATTRPDGRPHVMPVWGIWLQDRFFFGTDPKSRKARNLRRNSSLVIHLESGDDVVILEGKAQAVDDPVLLKRLEEVYHEKYRIRMPLTAPSVVVFSMVPAISFAWTEKDFPKTATRWELIQPEEE